VKQGTALAAGFPWEQPVEGVHDHAAGRVPSRAGRHRGRAGPGHTVASVANRPWQWTRPRAAVSLGGLPESLPCL